MLKIDSGEHPHIAETRGNFMSSKDWQQQRVPSRNIAQPVYFILRGAERRRAMATSKAKELQRELGVLPRLTSVK